MYALSSIDIFSIRICRQNYRLVFIISSAIQHHLNITSSTPVFSCCTLYPMSTYFAPSSVSHILLVLYQQSYISLVHSPLKPLTPCGIALLHFYCNISYLLQITDFKTEYCRQRYRRYRIGLIYRRSGNICKRRHDYTYDVH